MLSHVSEAASSIMTQSWLWGSQIAVKKNLILFSKIQKVKEMLFRAILGDLDWLGKSTNHF